MDPQAFIRLSVGSLGLRIHNTIQALPSSSSSTCCCEIRLRGFPVQTATVPLISCADECGAHPAAAAAAAPPDYSHAIASSFYLEDSDLKALSSSPGCFHTSSAAYLEVAVFTAGRKGRSHQYCGVGTMKRQQIGSFKLEVSPEWGEGKPVILFNGWIGIGKSSSSSSSRAELHLRVQLDPDPRYVFQFEDMTRLSPQVVQLQGSIKQPIFSCKFTHDRGVSHWSSSSSADDEQVERRERKGWKVKIHDLSGSAVAAAFITTPFVPSTGCDWVARSNPGAWLIVRPDATCRTGESWQPWGKLEAWRERGRGGGGGGGIRDSVCCRFRLLSHDEGDSLLLPEININAERGGEFFIDTHKHIPIPRTSWDDHDFALGGFVMSCRVQGQAKNSKPLVQLAMRHVTCVEDAAIFMALAASVDLSIQACKPFRRKIRRATRLSM